MKTLVKIAESAVKQDKNGRSYKTVTFSTPQTTVVNGKTVYLKPVDSSFNLYEKSYLNDKEDFGYSLPLGAEVQGAIESRTVQQYNIPTSEGGFRSVDTFKCIVLGDSTSPTWNKTVEAEMARRGHPVSAVVATPVEQEAHV